MKVRSEYSSLTREQAKIAIHDAMKEYDGNFTETVEKIRELSFVMESLSKDEYMRKQWQR